MKNKHKTEKCKIDWVRNINNRILLPLKINTIKLPNNYRGNDFIYILECGLSNTRIKKN